MIITLTGNLLAERTLTFSSWSPGATQRAQAESFQVGGKGINVSRMLSRIGSPSTAWCFAGGASGAECCEWLRERGLRHRVFHAATPTRTGLVVHTHGHPQTTFLAADRAVEAATLDACADALAEVRREGNILALCGSFPGWASADANALRQEIEKWIQADAFVADTYGPPLSWVVERGARLVKINRQEFDALFAPAEQSSPVKERLRVARQRWPVKQWVVTNGPEPVWYADQETAPECISPPKVDEVSATGSGDVFLACVLHALLDRKVSLAEAIAFALPFAAANAAHPGVAEFDLNLQPLKGSVHP